MYIYILCVFCVAFDIHDVTRHRRQNMMKINDLQWPMSECEREEKRTKERMKKHSFWISGQSQLNGNVIKDIRSILSIENFFGVQHDSCDARYVLDIGRTCALCTLALVNFWHWFKLISLSWRYCVILRKIVRFFSFNVFLFCLFLRWRISNTPKLLFICVFMLRYTS